MERIFNPSMSDPAVFSSFWVDAPDAKIQRVALGNSPVGSQRRWEILDSFRGLAALIVFLFHYSGMTAGKTRGPMLWEYFESLSLQLGSMGTNLLLLLSGVLVALSVSKPDFDYVTFLRRRAVRIYLPYSFVLLMGLCFAAIFPQLTKPIPWNELPRYLGEQLLLLPGLFPERPFLTVSWTLSYIVSGYILMPLGAACGRRLAISPLLTWFACFVLALIACVYFGFPSVRVCYIPAGCLLCEFYLERHSSKLKLGQQKLLVILTSLTIGNGLWLYFTGWQPSFFGQALPPETVPLLLLFCGLTGLSSIALLAFSFAENGWMPFRSLPWIWLQKLGKRGYSFYLLHGSITKLSVLILSAALSNYFAFWYVSLMVLLFSLALSIFCTGLLYHLVELPCVRWLGRHSKGFAMQASTP